jgi:hypothetical protein
MGYLPSDNTQVARGAVFAIDHQESGPTCATREASPMLWLQFRGHAPQKYILRNHSNIRSVLLAPLLRDLTLRRISQTLALVDTPNPLVPESLDLTTR